MIIFQCRRESLPRGFLRRVNRVYIDHLPTYPFALYYCTALCFIPSSFLPSCTMYVCTYVVWFNIVPTYVHVCNRNVSCTYVRLDKKNSEKRHVV